MSYQQIRRRRNAVECWICHDSVKNYQICRDETQYPWTLMHVTCRICLAKVRLDNESKPQFYPRRCWCEERVIDPHKFDINNTGVDAEIRRWIYTKNDKNTKPDFRRCPKCQVSIERSEGCDHVTCYMCNHTFCWECGIKKAKHSYNHKHAESSWNETTLNYELNSIYRTDMLDLANKLWGGLRDELDGSKTMETSFPSYYAFFIILTIITSFLAVIDFTVRVIYRLFFKHKEMIGKIVFWILWVTTFFLLGCICGGLLLEIQKKLSTQHH